jgi:predicted acyl esterase
MTGVTRRDFLTATGTLVAGTALARASDAVAAPSRAAWTLPAKRPFRVIENDWIPPKDGTRLAVRLWIPEGAEQRPRTGRVGIPSVSQARRCPQARRCDGP